MGILTKEQAQQRLEQKRVVNDVHVMIDAISDEQGGSVVVFTDDHCYLPPGFDENKYTCVPISTYFKMDNLGPFYRVAPRDGLKDGLIRSIQQFIDCFITDPVIETEEELLAFLNKTEEELLVILNKTQ